MLNEASVRAVFAGLNIKAGKVVMQFELDGECRCELPQLATMTGKPLHMDLSCDQQVMFVDKGSGEVVDGQEEAFPEEEPEEFEAEAVEELDPEGFFPELPEPSYEYADERDEAA